MLVFLVGHFLHPRVTFSPFKYTYSPQHPASKHPNTLTPQPVFFPFGRRDDFKDKLRQSEGFEACLNVTSKQFNINVKSRFVGEVLGFRSGVVELSVFLV